MYRILFGIIIGSNNKAGHRKGTVIAFDIRVISSMNLEYALIQDMRQRSFLFLAFYPLKWKKIITKDRLRTNRSWWTNYIYRRIECVYRSTI